MNPPPARDEAWFGDVYRRWHDDVARYARRRVPDHEADDVVAEVFATAWRRRDAVPDEPRLWLLAVARHAVLHLRRSGARRARLAHELRGKPDWLREPEQIVDVHAALDHLSAADREVLTLIAWEELTPAEAAVVLHCSAATVRVRLHRARRRLAAVLDPGDHRPFPAQVTEQP